MSWMKAHRVRGFDACFSLYVKVLVRRSFAAVWVRRDKQLPAAGGYVAAPNHHSWWDGLVPYLLHHERPAVKPFAIMMSDVELRRFPFFRFGGAFSIDASSTRSALDSVRYAAREAANGAAVWIFPEGRLSAPGNDLRFTSGFIHAARYANVPVVPVAMRFAMLHTQRPHAFVAYGEPVEPARGAARFVEREVSRLLHTIDADIRSESIERCYEARLRGAAGVDDRISVLTEALRRES